MVTLVFEIRSLELIYLLLGSRDLADVFKLNPSTWDAPGSKGSKGHNGESGRGLRRQVLEAVDEASSRPRRLLVPVDIRYVYYGVLILFGPAIEGKDNPRTLYKPKIE
ncbi:hypothetical protein E4U52_002438 [Claviceps spartinae]|nr:hypothetical protein E4U52_002438 [Claviceps spartinae]